MAGKTLVGGVRCREIAAEIGKALGQSTLTNLWIPDGMKDTCAVNLHNVVTDYDGYFDAAMALAAEWIGVQVPRADRIAESTTLRRSLSFPERGLSSYFGLPQESIRQAHRKLQVETAKIANINQEMASLFRSETISLQTLRIQGNLKSFDLDVLAR